MYLSAERLFLLFYVYAFAGWIIETVYRSLDRKRVVNPGFLNGPYLPLYGSGAIILVLLYSAISELHPALRGVSYLFALTLLEYVAGLLLLHLFNRRCWDYSDEPLNYRGLICPGFSLYWVILAFIFEKTLYPLSLHLLGSIDAAILRSLNILVLAVMAADFLFSSGVGERVLELVDRRSRPGLRFSPGSLLPVMAAQYEQANYRIAAWMARRRPELASTRRALISRVLWARSVFAPGFRLDTRGLHGAMIRLRGCAYIRKLIDTIKGIR